MHWYIRSKVHSSRECSLMFWVRTDPLRVGRTLVRMIKGCWPSAIPFFGMRWWEGEHSAIMVKRPGAFHDWKRVRQNRESDRKINPFFRIWGEFHYSFKVESKNLDPEKKVGRMPWIKYFLFLRQSCGTGRLMCGLLRLMLKWPLKANPPVKLFCKSKWLDIPGHCSMGQTVLMTVHHL